MKDSILNHGSLKGIMVMKLRDTITKFLTLRKALQSSETVLIARQMLSILDKGVLYEMFLRSVLHLELDYCSADKTCSAGTDSIKSMDVQDVPQYILITCQTRHNLLPFQQLLKVLMICLPSAKWS